MNLTLVTDIKAKWPQGQCSYSPGTPEELAIISVDLLVRELGTEAAEAFIAQVFERFGQARPARHCSGGLIKQAAPAPGSI